MRHHRLEAARLGITGQPLLIVDAHVEREGAQRTELDERNAFVE
jgi:hypothetical protein